MTLSQMEESLRGALQAVYCRHHNDVTSLSCYLERHLPLREPFFQLKRVPHFQVRDDLHHSDASAYAPILRLESACPEDVGHRGRAGCRRVLVEGDFGTGKTFLAYYLLQQWAQPKSRSHMSAVSGTRHDDIDSFKMVIYVDCVRLPVSDFLCKCAATRKRHVHVIACALLELVSPCDGRLFLDRVYDWLLANQSEVCVIYDNLDASDTWQQLIGETLREQEGFGKIVACTTPGRLAKFNIDSLFYCYGLHPDYSVKLVISRLKRVSLDIVDRAAIPKALDSSQELLRNPLTQSLVATYLKQMPSSKRPLTQFDFIDEIVNSAMAGDSYPVTLTDPHLLSPPEGTGEGTVGSRFTGVATLSPAASPTSLMSICETVAFECLESNTNYFCKYKLPTHFWSKHLCDCRILHEIHDVAKQGRPVVSFTSRCIRDYLASKRVCRYLLSDRDSNTFLNSLVQRRQFHSVVKFCIRQFVKLDRLDMVQVLLERLLAADPKLWSRTRTLNNKIFVPYGCPSRGRLAEQKEVLSWLRETDFNAKLLAIMSQHLPDVLEICYGDCPVETIQDFVQVTERAFDQLTIQAVVIYMDGMFATADLGLQLARSLRTIPTVTSLTMCLRCVVDTAFVVNFLCEAFEENDHLKELCLEGPFNSAENLTPPLHKRIRNVFNLPGSVSPAAVPRATKLDTGEKSSSQNNLRPDLNHCVEKPLTKLRGSWQGSKKGSHCNLGCDQSTPHSNVKESLSSANSVCPVTSLKSKSSSWRSSKAITTRLITPNFLGKEGTGQNFLDDGYVRSPDIPSSPVQTPDSPRFESSTRTSVVRTPSKLAAEQNLQEPMSSAESCMINDTDDQNHNVSVEGFKDISNYKTLSDQQLNNRKSENSATHVSSQNNGQSRSLSDDSVAFQIPSTTKKRPCTLATFNPFLVSSETPLPPAHLEIADTRSLPEKDDGSLFEILKNPKAEISGNSNWTFGNGSRTTTGISISESSNGTSVNIYGAASGIKGPVEGTSCVRSMNTPPGTLGAFRGTPDKASGSLARTLRTSVKPARCCSSTALEKLSLEHINYQHRVAYLLSCWPHIFHALEIRKSNVNTAGARLAEKVRGCRHLHTLVLDHCHITPTAFLNLLRQLSVIATEQRLMLKVLGLNLLSSARHFTRSDARKPTFRSALTLPCCTALGDVICRCLSLEDVTLRHNGIDDASFHAIAESASHSASLLSLDLTGNLVGDGARDDVITLMTQSKRLTSLFLHENSFSHDVRHELVENCAGRETFRLSL